MELKSNRHLNTRRKEFILDVVYYTSQIENVCIKEVRKSKKKKGNQNDTDYLIDRIDFKDLNNKDLDFGEFLMKPGETIEAIRFVFKIKLFKNRFLILSYELITEVGREYLEIFIGKGMCKINQFL